MHVFIVSVFESTVAIYEHPRQCHGASNKEVSFLARCKT